MEWRVPSELFVLNSDAAFYILMMSSRRNLGLMTELAGASQHWWPWFNISDPSSVALEDYREWYGHYGAQVAANITDCNPENEMKKVQYLFVS